MQQIADPNLSKDQRVQRRCELAGQLEEAGKFDAALEVLDEVWSELGERPNLSGIEPETAAKVLLRAGALTAYIGSAQAEGQLPSWPSVSLVRLRSKYKIQSRFYALILTLYD